MLGQQRSYGLKEKSERFLRTAIGRTSKGTKGLKLVDNLGWMVHPN